jgi:hypothetical protein
MPAVLPGAHQAARLASVHLLLARQPHKFTAGPLTRSLEHLMVWLPALAGRMSLSDKIRTPPVAFRLKPEATRLNRATARE